jgi:hypothetical protein
VSVQAEQVSPEQAAAAFKCSATVARSPGSSAIQAVSHTRQLAGKAILATPTDVDVSCKNERETISALRSVKAPNASAVTNGLQRNVDNNFRIRESRSGCTLLPLAWKHLKVQRLLKCIIPE